jgi:hypothetical protein
MIIAMWLPGKEPTVTSPRQLTDGVLWMKCKVAIAHPFFVEVSVPLLRIDVFIDELLQMWVKDPIAMENLKHLDIFVSFFRFTILVTDYKAWTLDSHLEGLL